jgi:hypothetical protein
MATALDAGRDRGIILQRRRDRPTPAARSARLAWVVLGVLMVGAAGLIYHETRGTTLWFDEWTWLLHRRTNSLASFLDTHNGHLSLIPVAIYKLLFATGGLRSWVPYRILVIAAHLGCCLLLFIDARRRVGPFLGLVAAALLLLFGPGWENLMWPFQIGWLLSLGAGLGALLALDREDRAGDVSACLLLAVSLASSGLGVPIIAGVALELGLVRRRPRDLWVVAVPLALYALWWIGYQHTAFRRHDIVLTPSFVANAAGSTLSALAGLAGSTGLDGQGSLMTWGPALLVAALAAAGWRLTRLRRIPVRAAALATMALVFWLLTALSRAFISSPFASRYLYVGAFFVILLAVELIRGLAVPPPALLVVGLAAAAAILSNVGALRDAGRLLRQDGVTTRADLAALDIGRPVMPAGYIAQGIPGYPFAQVPAAAYFTAAHDVGSPAVTPAQLAADPESARLTADSELIHIHRLTVLPAPSTVRLGPPPALVSASGGVVRVQGGCLVLAPNGLSGAGTSLAVTLRPGGALVQSSAASTVATRRFADQFQALGTLAADARGLLLVAADASPRPWQLEVTGPGRAAVCGVSVH